MHIDRSDEPRVIAEPWTKKTVPALLIVTFRPEFQSAKGGKLACDERTLNRLGKNEVGCLIAGQLETRSAAGGWREILSAPTAFPVRGGDDRRC
jgi:hypothetical protein